jgi:uncharacterized protein YggE
MKYRTLLLAIFAVFVLAAVPIAAQEGNSGYPMNTITVTGSGSASGTPDIANLEIGVEMTDPDVATAFEQTNVTVEAVINALIEVGVAREDIRTANVNIYQEDHYGAPYALEMGRTNEMQPEGASVFHVRNTVRVTIP